MEIPRPTASPIDFAKLPPVVGTVLAHRMFPTPLDHASPRPLFLAGIAAMAVVLAALCFQWVWLACLGVVALIAVLIAWRVKRPVRCVNPPRLPLAAMYRTWDRLISALQASPFAVNCDGKVIRERDHVFLGTLHAHGAPVLVHEQSLMHHALVCGPPASGKTYRFIVPASTQLLRRRDRSFVVVDLKGSGDLFQTFRVRAAQLRLPFKFFTLENGRTSHLFNPFLMPSFRDLTLNQRTQCLLEGLGLAYAEGGYGAGHFGAVNEEVMRAVLQVHPEISSFRELIRVLKAPGARRELGLGERTFEQASGLLAILDRMSETEQLQATPADGYDPTVFREAIDLREVMERPSVLYFHLPTNLERTSARLVGRLATTLLVALARREGRSKTPIVVVVDEFLQIIDSAFEPMLQQARDLKISFWLAHQYLAGLRTSGGDFMDLMLNCCHAKVLFGATDMAGRQFLEMSGGLVKNRYTTHTRSYTSSERPSSTAGCQSHDQVERRITQEHINAVNRNEHLGFLSVDPGYGYCQFKHPVVVRFGFSQSASQFRSLSRLPWPEPKPGTIPSSLPRAACMPEPLQPPATCGGPTPADRRREHDVAPRRSRPPLPERGAGAGDASTSITPDNPRPSRKRSPEELALEAELREVHKRLRSADAQ